MAKTQWIDHSVAMCIGPALEAEVEDLREKLAAMTSRAEIAERKHDEVQDLLVQAHEEAEMCRDHKYKTGLSFNGKFSWEKKEKDNEI
jgi:hypothetical protein